MNFIENGWKIENFRIWLIIYKSTSWNQLNVTKQLFLLECTSVIYTQGLVEVFLQIVPFQKQGKEMRVSLIILF